MTLDICVILITGRKDFDMSEAVKILPKIKGYLSGVVWDLGCHNTLVNPNAIGIDSIKFDNVKYVTDFNKDFSGFIKNHVLVVDDPDVIFASHVLEHVIDPLRFLKTCSENLVKNKGVLILYLPSCHHYDNINNPEHCHDFSYEVFVRWFRIAMKSHFKIIECGHDYNENDCYSFYLVAQKI